MDVKSNLLNGTIDRLRQLPEDKVYSCFICSHKSVERGLPLLVCETTVSSICLGEKLQEILSNRFTLLISPKDTVCWNCATCINRVDQYQHKIDILKEYIVTTVLAKYKHQVQIPNGAFNLDQVKDEKKEEEPPKKEPEIIEVKEKSPVIPQVAARGRTVRGRGKRGRPPGRRSGTRGRKPCSAATAEPKPKKYLCRFCGYSYSNECSLLSHVLQKHPPKFLCHVCDSPFTNKNSYESHMSLHFRPSSNKFKCKVCGFSTEGGRSAKHSCSDHFKVITCATCHKESYVSPQFTFSGVFECTCCKNTKVEPKVRDLPSSPRPPESIATQVTPSAPSHTPEPEPVVAAEGFSNGEEPCARLNQHQEIPDPNKCDPSSEDAPPNDADVSEGSDNRQETNPSPPFETPPVENIVVEQVLQEEEEEEVIQDCSKDAEHSEPVIVHCIEEEEQNPGTQVVEILEKTTCEKEFLDNEMLVSVGDKEPGDEKNETPAEGMVAALIRCPDCYEDINPNSITTHLWTHAVVEEAVAMDTPATENVVDAIEIVAAVQNDAAEEKKQRNISKLKCKTCDREFPTTNSLRHHWQITGHSWEVDTNYLELNKIMDKVNNTETTFKVLKQKFNIKTNMPVVPDSKMEIPESPGVKNMIVRVNNIPKCDKCSVTFPTEEMLKEHFCLTCVTCSVTFLNQKLLRKHYTCTGHSTKVFLDKKEPADNNAATLATATATNGLQCHVCEKKCNSRFLLGKHLAGHFRGTSRTACQFCLEELDKSEIQQHVLQVHGARLYKCEHCERTFMSSKFRDSHQAKHQHQCGDELQCRPCRSKFATHRALASHYEKFHREMSCRICGKYISDLYSLKRHENRHYYNKGLECSLCMKTFRNKVSLEAHTKTQHSGGELQFSCDICDRGFASRSALEEHRIVHINKKYTCGRCGTKCSSRIAYWVHSKMHDCPYSCSVCGRMYRDTSLLAVHRRKHWRVRPYQCPHCPRTFSVPATLRRHLTVHTRAYPHRCALCRRGFLTRYAFHKHLDTSHNIQQSVSPSRKPTTTPPNRPPKVPSLPLSATDEDLFQAADTLIADESVMFVDYTQRGASNDDITAVPTNEVVVETTQLFDQLLN